MERDLLEWFATEGLVRYSASASDDSDGAKPSRWLIRRSLRLGRVMMTLCCHHIQILRYAGQAAP